ncbi:MAG: hypothetical protein LBV12_06685 [Puniceicoccales bacterium]|jgi:hypothetical protein|nr:hypothetical protein [Puniceicoccales bacterium]
MKKSVNVFGAKASIHIRYSGNINSLASMLESELEVPEIWIQPREEPPYDDVGYAEVFGWELWLEKQETIKSFQYLLHIETSHSVQEIFYDRMHDISLWLARYISEFCKLDTLVSESKVMFNDGVYKILDD